MDVGATGPATGTGECLGALHDLGHGGSCHEFTQQLQEVVRYRLTSMGSARTNGGVQVVGNVPDLESLGHVM